MKFFKENAPVSMVITTTIYNLVEFIPSIECTDLQKKKCNLLLNS